MTPDSWIEYRADDASTWPPDKTGRERVVIFWSDDNCSVTLAVNLREAPSCDRAKITHWQPIVPPVKRRWMPEAGQNYWTIEYAEGGGLQFKPYIGVWRNSYQDKANRKSWGVFPTPEAAQAWCDKLNAFINAELGEI